MGSKNEASHLLWSIVGALVPNGVIAMQIYGLGYASLLAAAAFPKARIVATSGLFVPNKAVFRFKSTAFTELTGIPLTAIKVSKGIWDGAQFIAPNIRAANAYSLKVSGGLSDRSIWDATGTGELRYLPPKDLGQRLLALAKGRIDVVPKYNAKPEKTVISTLPLWWWYPAFKRSAARPVYVHEYTLTMPSSVHETVYYPYHNFIYRATIDGTVLKVESTAPLADLEAAAEPFGLSPYDVQVQDVPYTRISLGKLGKIDEDARRAAIRALTLERGVYSLGRWSTYRQIGIDAICKDIAVIKSMLAQDTYGRALLG